MPQKYGKGMSPELLRQWKEHVEIRHEAKKAIGRLKEARKGRIGTKAQLQREDRDAKLKAMMEETAEVRVREPVYEIKGK